MARVNLALALLVTLVLVLCSVKQVQSWSGPNVCRRMVPRYYRVRVCAYRSWWRCCRYRYVTRCRWVWESYCCRGYTHNGNQVCNIPVCNPPCENGGTCTRPGVCTCPTTHTGWRCITAVCSYRSPCFPGKCYSGDSCDCKSGFTTTPAGDKQNYCLKIEDNNNVDLRLTEMQVRLSYWPRHEQNPNERYRILADSTEMDEMDYFWTNRRDFNRLETTCSSQYFPPDIKLNGFPVVNLYDFPPYITNSSLGIVGGKIQVWLKKLRPGGVIDNTFVTSLNKTISCNQAVSSTSPEVQVYNCSVNDTNFDRFLEHRDVLKVTFSTDGGGFRDVYNTDTRQPYRTQNFKPVTRELAVQFQFDFLSPTHCEETDSCGSSDYRMLDVPDITRNRRIIIRWSGWEDEDSRMERYAWEVFKLKKITLNNGTEQLETSPATALQPLQPPVEVFDANYTNQFFDLPGPGMYAVILESGDHANNTVFTRRLVLYDLDPSITPDPDHLFFVTSASSVQNYRYQNDTSRPVVVSWNRHFRNALHEENALLASVRRYPIELLDSETPDGDKIYRKVIEPGSKFDDHEGQRTVAAIDNKRAIVKFHVQYVVDSEGGKNQPARPSGAWTDLDLATSWTVPLTPPHPSDGDTVTIWVKATDFMGTELVERRQVSFDKTPPAVNDFQFRMNVHVEGIHFSSTFELDTKDEQSGIALVLWTFRRGSTGQVIYQQSVPGVRIDSCANSQFRVCYCVNTGECFLLNQSYSLSNCNMMVDKNSLKDESVHVTADVTNMAGLVSRYNFTKSDLTELNGTQAYYPPQNITLLKMSAESVKITWSFPPSCFNRTQVTVLLNDQKFPVHKDTREYSLSGLDPGTSYTIYLVTDYVGNEQSDRAKFTFVTAPGDDGIGAGAIVGIVIAFLIIALIIVVIVIFVLWRRGKVFQKEGTPVNRQLHRMSRALTTVRKSVHLGGSFDNPAYSTEQDEIYMYGEMAFKSKQNWQMSDSELTLLDHIGEGRFATIYKATWRHDKKQDTVAAKMLKPGFSSDDELKMMAKINFMATKLEDHDNVLRFIGAVTDNSGWGPVLVLEYCEKGQLDKWLSTHKGAASEQLMEDLIRFTVDIAKGMDYLTSKQIVHRRLAARNVLLTFLKEAKVAGFGPQRKEGDDQGQTKERIPAKWSAPEMLQDKPPTEKSDVWSYGIVLWEIFSLGDVPYPGIRANEIGTRLKSGYRMDKPEFADDMFYDLMKECWQYKPNKRPTFSTIHARLSKLYSPGIRHDFYYDTSELSKHD